MTEADGLGSFLRASRARLEPEDLGIASGPSSRRVPGLRREEVAVLAGVSADYYARLEQGRERHPSPQVLDAIGRALRLGADARGHLYRLAGLQGVHGAEAPKTTVHPELLRLLDAFPGAAAYVLGPAFDVLAANAVAQALLAPFLPERNMARILFTDPIARTIYPEWDRMASATVHALRLNAGSFPADHAISALVEELSARSPRFLALWDDQNVGALTRMSKIFVHPEAGRIELTYQAFDARDAPGQQLLVGTPEPGSRSAQALAWLASMAPAS